MAKPTKTTTAEEPAKGNSMPPKRTPDANHPDVDTTRHAQSGLQEPNTAGGGATTGPDESPVANGMNLIGAGTPQQNTGQAGSGTLDQEALREQDYVFTHEQALALPVVEKGVPLRPLNDKQLDALHDKRVKAEKERIREYNEDRAPDKKLHVSDADNLPRMTPIYAFKDKDRRTLVVCNAKGGLAAMLSPEYADLEKEAA